jgi:hypothetical protein
MQKESNFMKRSILALAFAIIALIIAACGGGNANPTAVPPTTAPTNSSTIAPTAAPSDNSTEVEIEPANSTAIPTPSVLQATPEASSVINGDNGTAVATQPLFTPPATFADLLKQYPDLQPFLDKCKSFVPNSPDLCDFDQLYQKIVEIYKDKGATGVATFLRESGILEKLNLPESYLDLLTVYDKGGLDAVKKLAKDRGLISAKNEIVGYLAIDNSANVDAVKADLGKLGISTYGFDVNKDELEIGISLDLIAQYQTPGALIKFLTSIAQVNHVVGFRAPTPQNKSDVSAEKIKELVGAKTVGADKWHAAGITGQGIKIGILDMGFGSIKSAIGKSLPANVTSNVDLDTLDAQQEDHGTACAEIVYGMAPGADMYIAYFDGSSMSSFQDALDFLKTNKIQVLSYSVGSVVGPRDGTFGDALLVDEYVKDTGVLWVASAGNEAEGHSRFTYTDDGNGNHTFGKGKDGNDVTMLPFEAGIPQTNIVMDWNGSWGGKEKSEYDFTVFDADGNQIATASELKKGRKNDYPYQDLELDTDPGSVYYLSISRASGTTDNTLDIFVNNGFLPQWADVPDYSVASPGDSDSVLTVGATGLTKDALETYSSQGPTTDDRVKPDITAPTGEKLSLPDFEKGFYGTSGSAPLIAGAAALVMQANPDLTAPEVKAWLMKNVKDLGDKGPDPKFGAGRLTLGDPSGNGGGGDTNGPTPTAGSSNNAGGGTDITKVDVKFNQTFKGKKGIKVTVSFEVDNFKGKDGAVAILFFDKDGKTALKSTDSNYTIGGTIGTGTTFKPKKDVAVFQDVILFIPNSALNGIKSKKQITYVVALLDISDQQNVQILKAADPVAINVK